MIAPPSVHLIKQRIEAVNVRAALTGSVPASAVSNYLHRPEAKPDFEVVQDSAAPVGLGPEGNHDGHRARAVSAQDASDHLPGTTRARLLPIAALVPLAGATLFIAGATHGTPMSRIGQRAFKADGLLHQPMVTA